MEQVKICTFAETAKDAPPGGVAVMRALFPRMEEE
jgi:hypothetical protein